MAGLFAGDGGSAYRRSLSCLEALKRTDLEAAILIGSPVCGLRPLRAARLLTLKVPKPTIVKPPSFFIALPIASNTASTASPAAALVQPAGSRTISIRRSEEPRVGKEWGSTC